ncbi:GtrA family protein [Allorhizocola rhizosphaerae]|uniref:GtrA family protein n=1 Tax=Allorhizocola rhizosphaerae TaxID=1872709 RepID=UPI000E3E18CD|nr:GtrA family protein [Allorhizocola rhizosphaerae]
MTPNLVERLYQRFRHILHELGKFGVVGLFAYLVDSAILAYLVAEDPDRPLLAKTISTVVSATVAFVGNRFWTWRHRARSSLTREYLLYFGFNAAGLGIALATLGLTFYGLGAVSPIFQSPLATFISAQIVGNAFATVFRFWAYRRFVFIAPAPAPAEAATR